jgi:hypothetical protein
LFQPLNEDLKEADQYYMEKPLLAHYTSLSTLEKVLETDEVWFSNPLFMNDVEEVRFGLLRGLDLVLKSDDLRRACKSSSRALSFTQSFEYYFGRFEDEHAFDTYVFCLSEHDAGNQDGLLSMWRGYGGNGNGAAIVFDTAQLIPIENSPLILARVQYGSEEERIAWLEGVISKCAAILLQNLVSDDKLWLAAHALFERIKLFALFSKHRGFAEEQEWRVVYMKDRDKDETFASMFHYWVGPRGVEPKLRLKFAPVNGVVPNDVSMEKIVNRIILGPSLSSPLARTAILRMLDRLNKRYLSDRVCASRIPFRSR